MDGISGYIDTASGISPFDFSLDVHSGGQENEQGQRRRDASQGSNFDSVVADAFSFSAEALQKAKVLQQSDAVFHSDTTQTEREFHDAYTASYDALGRPRAQSSEEKDVKAPTAEELRRVPLSATPDGASVAALYAGQLHVQDNLQTRTFTPSNGASAYEGMRLRNLDSSRPMSVHINDMQSTSLAMGSSVSAQRATAAYQVQADKATPTTSMLPSSRWSIGIDMRV